MDSVNIQNIQTAPLTNFDEHKKYQQESVGENKLFARTNNTLKWVILKDIRKFQQKSKNKEHNF